MPVTFNAAPHKANAFPIQRITQRRYVQDILQGSCPAQFQLAGKILQTSFSEIHESRMLYSEDKGLVGTVLQAYNYHQALVLRPDDIWLAILA